MTAPEPRALFLVMLDQGERLRVVHDDEVVIEKVADAILVNHLLEDIFFDLGKIDFCTLQGIVHFLRDGEKIRSALNHSPLRAQSETIHEQSERRNYFSNAAAVVRGIEIRDAQAFDFSRPFGEFAERSPFQQAARNLRSE